MRVIQFHVNGRPVSVSCPPAKPLLDVLREDLDLTGAKECCGKGECGSCTVLLNDQSVCSCLVLVAQAEGADIRTVEDGVDGQLDIIQESFVEEGATQCGYCTPGIIVAARAFLKNIQKQPTREEIQRALAGNLCRCTGYEKIIRAVERAAQKMLA